MELLRTYSLDRRQFADYITIAAKTGTAKPARKLLLLGIAEVFIGGVVLAGAIYTKGLTPIMGLLIGVILLMGVFSLTYHPLIFRLMVSKAANKTYDSTPELHGEGTIKLTEDSVKRTLGDAEFEVEWKDITELVDAGVHYVVMVDLTNSIYVPADEGVRELIKDVSERFGKRIVKRQA